MAGDVGGLAADNDRNVWLRETLRVFLATTAAMQPPTPAMMLHRNTIQHRVQQAMDLSGHHFDDSEQTLDLKLAPAGGVVVGIDRAAGTERT